MKNGTFFIAGFLLLMSCNSTQETETTEAEQSINKTSSTILAEGIWRGEMQLPDGDAPFNFEVRSSDVDEISVFLLNAEERFQLDKVKEEGDSIFIGIDVYDALLVAKQSGDSLKGYFRRNQDGVADVPFFAVNNQTHRFELNTQMSTSSVEGNWEVTLTRDNGKVTNTVGLFAQEENHVTGTIVSRTGDYRFFEGVMDGEQLRLSAFSGSSPYLVEAKLINENQLEGRLITSTSTLQLSAKRNDTLSLSNPYELTSYEENEEGFSFSFLNLEGDTVSLLDEKYQGKAVVVTLMGTWCPNCVDEAAFLSPWYNENKHRGVEVIAVSFERKDDLEYARERLTKFINRFDVKYDVLFGGKATKENVLSKLPELDGVIAYPTTIFIDQNRKIREIHTGFYGPATGHYYQEFIDKFNAQIDTILGNNE